MQTSFRRVTGKQKHRQIYLKYIELIRLLFTYFRKKENMHFLLSFVFFLLWRSCSKGDQYSPSGQDRQTHLTIIVKKILSVTR